MMTRVARSFASEFQQAVDVAAYVKSEPPVLEGAGDRTDWVGDGFKCLDEPNERELPPAWSDGRWRLFENQWDIFDRQPHRNLGTRNPPKDTAKHRNP